jgi:uroporphyrin-III C-methyltransferase
MPLKHIERISEMLIDAGRAPDEPAALVSKATTQDQQVVVSTLSRISEDAAATALEPPAMFILGQVVRLQDGLDWLGALSGKKLRADPFGTKQLDDSA